MKYDKIVAATFLERDNRFVATVSLPESKSGRTGERKETKRKETTVKVHVKNTGRCRELLAPGATVYLEDFDGRMGKRKMRYDLIAVEKETPAGVLLVNMDSQAPNKVAEEALLALVGKKPPKRGFHLPGMGKLTEVRREVTYLDSRLDFAVTDEEGRRGFIEVKGVTLEEGGHATFPDAPTERGRKHLHTLMEAKKEGYETFVLFVIQMAPMKDMGPNEEHDPAFSETLREAAVAGVEVLAYQCDVMPDTLVLTKKVPLRL